MFPQMNPIMMMPQMGFGGFTPVYGMPFNPIQGAMPFNMPMNNIGNSQNIAVTANTLNNPTSSLNKLLGETPKLTTDTQAPVESV